MEAITYSKGPLPFFFSPLCSVLACGCCAFLGTIAMVMDFAEVRVEQSVYGNDENDASYSNHSIGWVSYQKHNTWRDAKNAH